MRNEEWGGETLHSAPRLPSGNTPCQAPAFSGQNMQKIYKNPVKFHVKSAKKSRFATFWGKLAHFMGFPPFCSLFHRSFTHPRWKMGEVTPFYPKKMGKKGVNFSHFQRSFPQKNCRKPLILLGFRRFSTVCSQVEIWGQLYSIFRMILGGFCHQKKMVKTPLTYRQIHRQKAEN